MTVLWTTSDGAVATVSGGTVTPLTAGTAYIYATTQDGGFVDSCLVTVTTGVISVTSISINPHTMNLVAGGATGSITATVLPANATDMTVLWTTSDGAVATVSGGTVTPLTAGIATIYATTQDGGFVDSCLVTVTNNVPVTGVILTPDTIHDFCLNEDSTLTVTILPLNATNQGVTWESSNMSVATIVAGTVTALSIGEADIIVTTADGFFKDTCHVIVAICPGISSAPEKVAMMVYPNPTKGNLTIEIFTGKTETMDIQIQNALGNVVYTERHVQVNGKLIKSIDMSGYSEGVYFLKLSGDTINQIKRIVVQR
jgi:uncharacterized protein YjdB